MSEEVTINNGAVIPTLNMLMALQSWLRPGWLSFRVQEHFDALKPAAVRLEQEHAALVEEAAQHYPPDHAKAGQLVPVSDDDPLSFKFKSHTAGVEFQRRRAELMSPDTTIVVSARLTIEDMRRMDSERLPAPRLSNGLTIEQTQVDFTLLLPLLAKPTQGG